MCVWKMATDTFCDHELEPGTVTAKCTNRSDCRLSYTSCYQCQRTTYLEQLNETMYATFKCFS